MRSNSKTTTLLQLPICDVITFKLINTNAYVISNENITAPKHLPHINRSPTGVGGNVLLLSWGPRRVPGESVETNIFKLCGSHSYFVSDWVHRRGSRIRRDLTSRFKHSPVLGSVTIRAWNVVRVYSTGMNLHLFWRYGFCDFKYAVVLDVNLL